MPTSSRRLATVFMLLVPACLGAKSGRGGGDTSADETGTSAGSSAPGEGEGEDDGDGEGTGPNASGASGEGTSGAGGGTGTQTSGSPSETAGGNTAGDAGLTLCQEECQQDSDCLVNGLDQNYVCTSNRCRPTRPDRCLDDTFCRLVTRALFGFCGSSLDCSDDDVCVELTGYDAGVCASLSRDAECSADKRIAVTTIEGQDVEVCGLAEDVFVCDPVRGEQIAFFCAPGGRCESDNDCEDRPGTPVCAATGQCVCTRDDQCGTSPGASACVGGRCGCRMDDDCVGVNGADRCAEGHCGCASDGVCPTETFFDGTQTVCESP